MGPVNVLIVCLAIALILAVVFLGVYLTNKGILDIWASHKKTSRE